jgi:hypothetical protein
LLAGQMGRDLVVAQLLNKIFAVVAFVAAQVTGSATTTSAGNL